MQGKLPLNEYFYVRLKALWAFKYDTSNSIEVSMVYALRYITMVSLSINVNSFLIMQSQTLILTTEGT